MIGGAVGERAEVECDRIVEPVVLPKIFLGDFMHNLRQPARQRALKFGYVDIFRGKPEIARKHQRRASIDRDLQLRSRQHRRATNLIECIQQGVAAEGCTHHASLMRTPPPASASSG